MDKVSKQIKLEKRTLDFSIDVIRLLKKISITSINKRLIEQLIGSAGSIGANYREATASESKKDFIHKMLICKKEIKETEYWIRLLAETNKNISEELRILWKENQELLYIFSKAVSTTKKQLIK